MPVLTTPDRIVEVERYPIDRRECAERAALVARCRDELERSSACVLEGFLRAQAVDLAVSELTPRLGNAFYCEKSHNPYLAENDPALGRDHPRNRAQASTLGALADDQIPKSSALRALYVWSDFQAFVANVLGVEHVFPYADPLASLNLNVFREQQELGWHYDNADWVVTIMLQPAGEGGVYEYVPGIRRPGDENYDEVASVLDGEHPGVRSLDMGKGALVLFRGRRTLHRVTPVTGPIPRLVAVLSYDTVPGVMLTEFNRRLFYGRVA